MQPELIAWRIGERKWSNMGNKSKGELGKNCYNEYQCNKWLTCKIFTGTFNHLKKEYAIDAKVMTRGLGEAIIVLGGK